MPQHRGSSVADDGHHIHLDSIESPAIVARNQDLCAIVPVALMHRANPWLVESIGEPLPT